MQIKKIKSLRRLRTPGWDAKCDRASNCITNVWYNFSKGGGGKNCQPKYSAKLKATEIVSKHRTLVEKLFLMGIRVNNSDTTIQVHWDWIISKWVVGARGGS